MSDVSPTRATEPGGWPVWARLAASVVIIFHLAAVAGLVFSTETGPWVVPDGVGVAHAPFFALRLFNPTRTYREYLGLTEDYRFRENAVPEAGSRFEIRMKDEAGKVTETLLFPDPEAWPGERYRQQLIANVLAGYTNVDPPAGEKIPAPGQAPDMKSYWQRSEDGSTASLKWVPEHLLPRTEDAVAPTQFAQVLADSLARQAKARGGNGKVEVVLVRRPTFGPVVVMPELNRQVDISDFDAVEFKFGEKP